MSAATGDGGASLPRRRRERYRGTHPRRFHEKYKELDPARYPEAIARVRERGQTPAGQHVPILVEEVLAALGLNDAAWLAGRRAAYGEVRALDVTLGYGGHAERILAALALHGGALLGLDQDPATFERTTARLAALPCVAGDGAMGGGSRARLVTRRTNFAALAGVAHEAGFADGFDVALADLGVSSMQLDDPARGFSTKHDGPLDMRMNPARGLSAAEWLRRTDERALAAALTDGADEPFAAEIARALGSSEPPVTTRALADAVRAALPHRVDDEARELSVRRVFQAIRIAVNDELGVLDRLLAALPHVVRAGGRVAILSFHSGEDRRIKRAFEDGCARGTYARHNDGVTRPSADERRANPRATAAKLRWAERA